jgi:serine phosphatase RsbU (regulator of sigma subunit)
LIEVPAPANPGLETYAAILPKADVAADFLEFAVRDGRLFAAIGDAPAVGLRAHCGAIPNVFQHFLANHDECPSPGEVLRHVDATVRGYDAFARISMQCVAVDPAAAPRHCERGPSRPGSLRRGRGKCDLLPLRADPLLGAEPDEAGMQRTQYEVEMEPGDVFVMMTDGLTEDHAAGRRLRCCSSQRLLQDRARDGPAQWEKGCWTIGVRILGRGISEMMPVSW